MKSESNKMYCYICGSAPIRRICLADEIIQNRKYLFCDSCRKQEILRKHGSEIYQIDSYSAPVSLLSINSTEKQEAKKITESVQTCRSSTEQKVERILDTMMSIDEKILKKLEMLQATFDSENAQKIEEQLKNHSSNDRQQILKKVLALKWLKQNKDFISNASSLSEKISTFAKDFQQAVVDLFAKMESLIVEFVKVFDMDNLFVEKKKDEKSQFKQKEHLIASKSTKKNKQSDKLPITKSISQFQIKPEKDHEPMRQERSNSELNGMDLQNQNGFQKFFQNPKYQQSVAPSNELNFEKMIFPSYSVKKDLNTQAEKAIRSSENKCAEVDQQKNIKKQPSKPLKKIQAIQNEQQALNRPLPLILQKISTKFDYPQEQKLVISLKNMAEVFWILNEQRQMPQNSIQDPKLKYENGMEKIVEENIHLNNKIDTKKIINLRSIKYLEVRELPKRSVEIFAVNIEGKDTNIRYSIQKLYEKIVEMQNLEQLHIFTSTLFPSEEQLLTVLFTCSNIKVVSFCCFNPSYKMLPQFKEMVGDQFNEQIKIFEMAGNIPFYEDIEIADAKCYFPESEKNKKIYDEKFAKNFDSYIEDYIKYSDEKVSERQRYEHRNSCWFVPYDKKQIQKERISHIPIPAENNLLLSCFNELRTCWIPYMTTEQLTQMQSKTKLQKIQYLTLGFHHFELQSIPEKFYYGEKNDPSSIPFCKFLTNLKSLNLINLNINEFFMRKRFCSNWKDLISLKIQNCVGLSNTFFKNLPQYCPKLTKIFVNNIQTGIEGDFLTKFQQLETIILPWSELSYSRSQKIDQIENQRNSQLEDSTTNKQVLAEGFNSFILKKWKYVNLYGCSWFHTDFFALLNPETLEHLNIGKCKNLSIEDLVYYLKRFRNLESLCLDEVELNNKDLFGILRRLPKLTKLSVAHCSNLNFSFDNLGQEEVHIFDRMTHLDLRNRVNHIAVQYTVKMKNPKYLIVSRGFQLEENQPQTLAQRHITACSSQF